MKTHVLLSEGARQVLRFRKLIAVYYIVNLLAAAIVALPIAALIGTRLGHSLESERLFANFDVAWAMEVFYDTRGVPFVAIGVVAGLVAVLFLLLNTFLAGGAIAVFHRENETFFGACARYFPRLLRLFVLSLLFLGAVLALNGAFNAAFSRVKETSMVARPWAILHWVRLGFMLFLFGFVNMVFDYAKIVCIADDRRSAIKATGTALRFVFGNLGRTLKVYWSCAAFALLFLLAYHGLSEVVGQNSAFTVILLAFIRQIYVVARIWVKLWTWSSELRVYTFNSTIVAPEPPSLAVAG